MTHSILFLTKYDRAGASSRYRIYQYLPCLDAAGIEYSVCPLLDASHVNRRYGQEAQNSSLARLAGFARSFADRARTMLTRARRFDLVFIQYEALPYVPIEIEAMLLGEGRHLVADYDDATYVAYANHENPFVRRLLSRKIPRLVQRCAHVIVGNRYLGEWASQLNPNVSVIPTSVDLSKYPLPNDTAWSEPRPAIAWIGTPVTAKYIRVAEAALRAVRQQYPYVLRVIGAPEVRVPGVDIEHVSWDEATEGDDLARCVAGIMPLTDGQWERGKSALKLIQYMAAGAVGIASPVGANCEVVQDGVTGFLASTEEEWIAALSLVLSDHALAQRIAQAGRQTVERYYSLQANATAWVSLLRSLCS